MFSYTYKVRILGTFTDNGTTVNFTTAVRKLPIVSYIARHLNQREISSILNKTNEKGVEIGHLCIGEDIANNKSPILFEIGKLRSKRTMVFAQSGFGKTNLVKVILYHMARDTSYGKLIFDLNGEYFLRGTNTYGLGDIDDNQIKDNVVVYTDKKIPEKYVQQNRFIYGGKVTLNMHKHLSVGDILNFGAGFSEVMKSFLLYLDEDGVSSFIGNIDDYVENPSNLYRDFSDFFGEQKTSKSGKEDVSARKTIMAIRKRIRRFIDEGNLHSGTSNLIDNVFKYLKQGKTIIIDLSLKDNMDASIISTILVRKLFESNKEEFTSDNPKNVINAVLFVEEAQNVLSQEFVRSNANPFVRVAKEGRKFGLGLVAVTQRPSAISDEIRTQAENFFAFHMGNSDDIKALVKSNINYDGVIAKFIQRETIPGNLYMVSSDQAFALPVRVTEFEKLVADKVYKDSRFNP
jgi:uncharacterized protein